MTKYLYLFRGGDDQIEEMSPEQTEAHMKLWETWIESLAESGNLIEGEALTASAKVVNKGGDLVTDGPFMEGKEVVGGYVLLNAASMEEAVELSRACPIFVIGGLVEVREIAMM
ncbi:MAG TPA: hypothetical protein ENJ82_17700 [Bacteroidetes bacterium]|nr:hypothetical protein [Bacteroidota bacterium]